MLHSVSLKKHENKLLKLESDIGNFDSYVRGVSQAYSQLVSAYCIKKTISPFSVIENSTDFPIFFSLLR